MPAIALAPAAIQAIGTYGVAAALALGLISQADHDLFISSGGSDLVKPGTAEWEELFPTAPSSGASYTPSVEDFGGNRRHEGYLDLSDEELVKIVGAEHYPTSDREVAQKILSSRSAQANSLGFANSLSLSTPEEIAAIQPYIEQGVYTETSPGVYILNPSAAITAYEAGQTAKDLRERAPTPLPTTGQEPQGRTFAQADLFTPANEAALSNRERAREHIAPTRTVAGLEEGQAPGTAIGTQQPTGPGTLDIFSDPYASGTGTRFNQGLNEGQVQGQAQGRQQPTSVPIPTPYVDPFETGQFYGQREGFTEGQTPGTAIGTQQPTSGQTVQYSPTFEQGRFYGTQEGLGEGQTAGTAIGTQQPTSINADPIIPGDQFGSGTGAGKAYTDYTASQLDNLPEVIANPKTASAQTNPFTGTATTNFQSIIDALNSAGSLEELNTVLASAGGINDADPAVVEAYNNALGKFDGSTGLSEAGNILVDQAVRRNAGLSETAQGRPFGVTPIVGSEQQESTFGPSFDDSQLGKTGGNLGPTEPSGNAQGSVPDSQINNQGNQSNPVLGPMVNNIQKALASGYTPNEVATRLRDQAKVTGEETARAAMLQLGAGLITGSFNEMAKNIGQAGINNRAYSPQLNFGDQVNASLQTSLAGQEKARVLGTQADAVDQQQKATELQKFGILQSNLDNIAIKDDDGNNISLSTLQKSNPSIYNEVVRMLAQGSPEDVQDFVSQAGLQGLPPQIFGIEPTATKTDWSNPLISNNAKKADLLNNIKDNNFLHSALRDISWSEINAQLGGGNTPNREYNPNGDTRKFVKRSTPNEGLGRFAPYANTFLNSDVVSQGLPELFHFDSKGDLDIERTNTLLKQLPVTDARQINTLDFMLNLFVAAGITGLAGVENLTELLNDKAAKASLLENPQNLLNFYALGFEQLGSTAKAAGQDTKLSEATNFVNKYGGKAFIRDVLSQSGGNRRIVMLGGQYYVADPNAENGWRPIGG